MMRSLFIFGTIALYVVCAFVPPSQANIETVAAQVLQMKKGNASAVVKATLDPRVTVLVDAASRVVQGDRSGVFKDVAHFAVGVAPDIKKAKMSLVKSIGNRPVKSSPFTLLVENEKNPIIRKQLERIDWAVGKSDPKLCKTLEETHSIADATGVPQFGDLLALCLARVMHDSARCSQIDGAFASTLRSACTEGLDQMS